MALLELKTNPTDRELRQFGGIVLPLLLAIAGAWLGHRTQLGTVAAVLWVLGAASLVVGCWRPRLLRPIFVGWMIAAYPIGWTVSHLLLAAIYFLVIAPIGVVLKLLGRDPLDREFDRGAESYWIPCDSGSDPARYFRQF